MLIPTAIFQMFTVFLLTLLVTLIANGHGDFGLANVLPWILVGAYFAWATSALIVPLGAGRYLADGIGARRPHRRGDGRLPRRDGLAAARAA